MKTVLFIAFISTACLALLYDFSHASGGSSINATRPSSRRTSGSSILTDTVIISRRLISATECANETFQVGSKHYPRAYYYKSFQETTLTLVRDAVSKEILLKETSERILTEQEKFESTIGQYYTQYLTTELAQLLVRCKAHRSSSILEIDKNKPTQGEDRK